MNIKPYYDRVFIQRIHDETKTASGLFIPEQAKERPYRGTVIAVGEGKRNADGSISPLKTQPGDQVIFGKYAGSELRLNNQEYLIVKEEDIFANVQEYAQEDDGA